VNLKNSRYVIESEKKVCPVIYRHSFVEQTSTELIISSDRSIIMNTKHSILLWRSTLYAFKGLWQSSLSSVICQATDPMSLPKRFLHLMRSRASSFKLEYPLLSLRSSSSFLRLLPRLLVTSICPYIFPSITSFRRQFLRKI
jgi:hypothetical protein